MDYINYQNPSLSSDDDSTNAPTTSPITVRTVEPNRSQTESTEQRLYGSYRNNDKAVRNLIPVSTPDAPLIFPLFNEYNTNEANALNSQTQPPMLNEEEEQESQQENMNFEQNVQPRTNEQVPLPSFITGRSSAQGGTTTEASRSSAQMPMGMPYESDGMIPEPAPSMRPQPAPGMRPQPAPGMQPQPFPGMQPQPAPGMQPQPFPGMRPEPTPGMRPQPAPGMRPQPAPGMQPQPFPSMQPQPFPGMQPQPFPGMRPQPFPGMQPQPSSGMRSGPIPGANMSNYQMNSSQNMLLPVRSTPYYNLSSSGYESLNDFDEAERDMEYLRQFYPTICHILQREIEEECDRLEYEGSVMFDEYPDKVTLEHLIHRICNRVRNYEELKNYEANVASDQVSANQVPFFNRCPGPGCNFIDDFVRILFLNEIHNRRRRHRSRRRWFY